MSDTQSAKQGDRIPESELQVILFPVDMIDPSPFQARKNFPQQSIDEMAASVLQVGVLQALIVRVVDEDSGRLELVIGERRLRGARQAGLMAVPVQVRELTNNDAAEILLIENLQRDDLSQSDEASGYDRMLKLKDDQGKALYTVESLAGKLSKTVAHVVARLKLLVCPQRLIEAVDEGVVSISTAELVGRIPEAKAREEAASLVLAPDTQDMALNFVQTREMINDRFVVKLDKRQFDLDDPMLVPVRQDENGQRCLGGACTDCPFRSGNMEGVEVRKFDGGASPTGGTTRGSNPHMCTLPRCHKLKLDAAWAEKKQQVLQKGGKVLDGDEAKKAFAGLNGDLAFDADYVDPDAAVNATHEGVYVSKVWKEAVKGQAVQPVLARHPDTKQVVQVYLRKDAEEAVRTAVKAEISTPSLGAGSGSLLPNPAPTQQSDEDVAKAEAADAAKVKEAEQARLNEITVAEAVREIIDGVTSKGASTEFYNLIFQMALSLSGADGMHFMGHHFGLKLPKGIDRHILEAGIIEVVKERAETPNAWLGHIVAALISRQVKWNGVTSDDMEMCLGHVGIKLAEIKRRAQSLYAVEKKAKKKVPEKATTKGTSTDPVDVSAEKEAGKTAAADAAEKRTDDRVVLKEYTATPGEVPFILEALFGLEIPVTTPNEHGVFVRRASISVQANRKTSFAIDLARAADGRWSYGQSYESGSSTSLGGGGYPSDDEMSASRAEAVKKAAMIIQKHFERVTDVPKANKSAHADALLVIGQVIREAESLMKQEGPSSAEERNGVQDSKIGKPAAFNETDVANAAACLAAETTDIKTLIGTPPKRAEKEALKLYNRVRLQLRRAAAKITGAPDEDDGE